jgi:hypothetical protein
MACGVVHRALRAAVIAIGQVIGAFVASWPPTAPTHGAPASSWLPPAFFFFLLLLLPLPPPWACVSALGLLCPFVAWVNGEC